MWSCLYSGPKCQKRELVFGIEVIDSCEQPMGARTKHRSFGRAATVFSHWNISSATFSLSPPPFDNVNKNAVNLIHCKGNNWNALQKVSQGGHKDILPHPPPWLSWQWGRGLCPIQKTRLLSQHSLSLPHEHTLRWVMHTLTLWAIIKPTMNRGVYHEEKLKESKL